MLELLKLDLNPGPSKHGGSPGSVPIITLDIPGPCRGLKAIVPFVKHSIEEFYKVALDKVVN